MHFSVVFCIDFDSLFSSSNLPHKRSSFYIPCTHTRITDKFTPLTNSINRTNIKIKKSKNVRLLAHRPTIRCNSLQIVPCAYYSQFHMQNSSTLYRTYSTLLLHIPCSFSWLDFPSTTVHNIQSNGKIAIEYLIINSLVHTVQLHTIPSTLSLSLAVCIVVCMQMHICIYVEL